MQANVDHLVSKVGETSKKSHLGKRWWSGSIALWAQDKTKPESNPQIEDPGQAAALAFFGCSCASLHNAMTVEPAHLQVLRSRED
jgi:hypothetical protein